MSRSTPNTLRTRLAGLEQARRQRRQPPAAAFYHHDVEGDADASADHFLQQYGRRPAVLLPFNGREEQ